MLVDPTTVAALSAGPAPVAIETVWLGTGLVSHHRPDGSTVNLTRWGVVEIDDPGSRTVRGGAVQTFVQPAPGSGAWAVCSGDPRACLPATNRRRRPLPVAIRGCREREAAWSCVRR